MSAIIVIAKSPVPGRVKTRLCPPCTPRQAADIAEAALADTLAAVAISGVDRCVVALEGAAGCWLPTGFDVVSQRGRGLACRIAAAFEDVGGPALLIGMDTPQITPGVLANAVAELYTPRVDAVLGPAEDGGWWALGLRKPDPAALFGVPMSTPATWAAQRDRLELLEMRVGELPRLRDVDSFDDALAVASLAPDGRFAAVVHAVAGAGVLAGVLAGVAG